MLQQYPDALMLRIACALARLVTQDPNSPIDSGPSSPVPKKPSLKSKQGWRSASMHADTRTQITKCPFSATNALTAATKEEINAFKSSEEIRAKTISCERIHEGIELVARCSRKRSESINEGDIIKECHKSPNLRQNRVEASNESERVQDHKVTNIDLKEEEPVCPLMSLMMEQKKNSKPATPRKTSCTVALDIYRRRGSGIPCRSRLNSLGGDRLTGMQDKFGTPDKVMHFFGRCFVKFFSNYG